MEFSVGTPGCRGLHLGLLHFGLDRWQNPRDNHFALSAVVQECRVAPPSGSRRPADRVRCPIRNTADVLRGSWKPLLNVSDGMDV
jgi:hypothetical protein